MYHFLDKALLDNGHPLPSIDRGGDLVRWQPRTSQEAAEEGGSPEAMPGPLPEGIGWAEARDLWGCLGQGSLGLLGRLGRGIITPCIWRLRDRPDGFNFRGMGCPLSSIIE